MALHASKTDWAEPIVNDNHVFAQYISLGPGGKVLTSMETDTKMWFIVLSGELRVDIKGVPPFVATKDFIVQVPMRTPFSLETVGDQPSLRFEVRIESEPRTFPVGDNPTPPKAPAGYTTVKALDRGAPEQYSDTLKAYLDFQTEFVKAERSGDGAALFSSSQAAANSTLMRRRRASCCGRARCLHLALHQSLIQSMENNTWPSRLADVIVEVPRRRAPGMLRAEAPS